MEKYQSYFSKHILFVAIIFLMATNFVFAQSYTNSPNDTLIKNVVLEQSIVMNIVQLHTTNDTLIFHYKKLSASIPFGWDASLCVNGACYTTLLDSGIQAPAVVGDNGLMSLHCTPHQIAGTAIIRYTQFSENNVLKKDTLTWVVQAVQSGVQRLDVIQPNIYYKNYQLFLENVDEKFSSISVFGLDGKEFLCMPLFTNSIEITKLPNIFLVHLNGKNISFNKKIYHAE
jgi:hypothetical protein